MCDRTSSNPSSRRSQWVIVGGGFLGMTLALRLAQQGKAVTVLEAAGGLGGLASAWNLNDIVWDKHYHVILQSDSKLRSLLREIGLEHELTWGTTRTGFYVDEKLYSLSNTLEFLRFPALNLFDKLRLAATILHASRIKNGKALEGILVADWLQRWSGRRVWEKLWLPLLRAKLGDSYRESSATFIWSTLTRLYGARNSGSKKEVFGYVRGGYARIIENFATLLRKEGVEYQLGAAVSTICSEGKKVRIELPNGGSRLCDNVVLTTAAPIVSLVCPQLTPDEKARLRAIKYQGIICCSLLLDRPLSDFYITNIAADRVPFTAVIEMSALVDRKNFGGCSLVYLPKYLSCNADEFQMGDEQIRYTFLNALGRMFPRFNRSSVSCFRISRVKYLLPIPTLYYSDKVPAVKTSIPGVHVVNSAQILNGTLNVNETVGLAERAAAGFAGIPALDSDGGVSEQTDETHRQSVA
jgi:protoporphyrinogen oxidase